MLFLNIDCLIACKVSAAQLSFAALHGRHKNSSKKVVDDPMLGRWPWENIVRLTMVTEEELELETIENGASVRHRWPSKMLSGERSTVCGLVARFAKGKAK